jgi:hypothetical protein
MQAVPPALLEREARVDLLVAAERLPRVLSRWNVGLELRLQGPPQGDLFIGALPTAEDGPILQEWLRDFPGSSAGVRLGLALSQWQRGLGWYARCCRFLLLEVDASRRAGDSLPPPAVFLIPRDDAFRRDPDGLVSALAELGGCPPDAAVAAELRDLLALLPDQAQLFTAGVMLSRPTSAAPRIAVRGLRSDELAPLLSGLGRPGAGALLAPLAVRLAPGLTDLCVAFDLGPGGSDAVGLELYAADASSWGSVLNDLAELDLADPDRARAAAELARAGALDDSARLNHVKLTATAGGLGPTKLYAVMRAPPPLSG